MQWVWPGSLTAIVPGGRCARAGVHAFASAPTKGMIEPGNHTLCCELRRSPSDMAVRPKQDHAAAARAIYARNSTVIILYNGIRDIDIAESL